MANLSITAASVVAGAGAQTEAGVAGAAVTAGQVVYKATTGKYLPADADEATVAERTGRGIALNGAALDQPLKVLTSGPITIGATLTAGVFYYLSDDPGAICPVADVTGGNYIVQVGYAKTASVLEVSFKNTNVAT